MEQLLLDILNQLRQPNELGDKMLEMTIRKHNRNIKQNKDHHSKKKLVAYYVTTKSNDPRTWANWNIDPELEKRLMQVLQIKPGRTASGVATITVITKPWPCASDCLYCPNDLTMPKSYLFDEPACQRAAWNYFDPYLQVATRLRALAQMGHVTDKIELIVLGGTWSDYPDAYRIWFIKELFRALNDSDAQDAIETRIEQYRSRGIGSSKKEIKQFVASEQELVDGGLKSYNESWKALYGSSESWSEISALQQADMDELVAQQVANETATHRMVGLVVETRPDDITPERLFQLRELGCTKVQIGIQSLNEKILKLNNRNISLETIERAFELLRIFGFKIHAHIMVNLYGSSHEEDKKEYLRFVTEKPFQPDEIKLYPCVLIGGTALNHQYEIHAWRPYTDKELLDVLITDILNTPPFIRVSRMIRDFSAHDIKAGSKTVNLRQLVEQELAKQPRTVQEIRYREIARRSIEVENLKLDIVEYTTANTDEFFLQWITPDNDIAGFLRLSLPHQTYVEANQAQLPIKPDEAMIREVHVYGKVARLSDTNKGVQHFGLGKQLIAKACQIAQAHGYAAINVISSVGTRDYYRSLGFEDHGLYQQKSLELNRCD